MRVGQAPVAPSLEEARLDGTDCDQGDEHHGRGEDGDPEIAESDGHPQRSHDPDGGRRREASHVFALTEYRARPEEADAGDDLGGDTRRVDARPERWLEGNRCEQARAHRDQRHRAYAGRMSVVLTLRAKDQTNGQRDEYAKAEFDVALDWQVERRLAAAAPAARLVFAARLVGQLRQIEAVHEIPENREALIVDLDLALVLVVGLVRVGDDARRIHHLGRHEDGALRAHRERDGVGGPGVEVEVSTILLDVQARVEDLVREPRDDDALDAHTQVAERGGHEVVGQGPADRVARDLGRNGLRLEGTDPDGEVAVGFLLLQDDEVLSRRHMDTNAVDGDLDEVLHPRVHSSLRSSASLLFERAGR